MTERGGRRRRVLIVSTPRCGNTWLRQMVADAFGLHSLAVHHPAELGCTAIPQRAVVQLHWPHGPDSDDLLPDRHGTLTLIRHPFDILLSVARFAHFSARTSLWLLGRSGGNEEELVGATPADPQLIRYAGSDRFRSLLDVSATWAGRARTVRYEDLAADPVGRLTEVAAYLGEDGAAVRAGVHGARFAMMRAANPIHHPRGQVSDWRRFLTADVAGELTQLLAPYLRAWSYRTEPDPDLRPDQARERWHQALLDVGRPVPRPEQRVAAVVAYAGELAMELSRRPPVDTELPQLPPALRLSARSTDRDHARAR